MSFLQKSLSKIWLVSCVLLQIGAFGFCPPAQAADLPSDKEPALAPAPLSPAPFSWTGFYAGVNGGFGLDHYAFTYSYFPPGVVGQGAKSGITSSGPLIGGQIGYNYELTNLPIIDHAVIGIEADEQWTDFHGSVDIPVSNGIFHIGTQLENYGSLRSRVGYNFDRLLFYFTGGLRLFRDQELLHCRRVERLADAISLRPLSLCRHCRHRRGICADRSFYGESRVFLQFHRRALRGFVSNADEHDRLRYALHVPHRPCRPEL